MDTTKLLYYCVYFVICASLFNGSSIAKEGKSENIELKNKSTNGFKQLNLF